MFGVFLFKSFFFNRLHIYLINYVSICLNVLWISFCFNWLHNILIDYNENEGQFNRLLCNFNRLLVCLLCVIRYIYSSSHSSTSTITIITQTHFITKTPISIKINLSTFFSHWTRSQLPLSSLHHEFTNSSECNLSLYTK